MSRINLTFPIGEVLFKSISALKFSSAEKKLKSSPAPFYPTAIMTSDLLFYYRISRQIIQVAFFTYNVLYFVAKSSGVTSKRGTGYRVNLTHCRLALYFDSCILAANNYRREVRGAAWGFGDNQTVKQQIKPLGQPYIQPTRFYVRVKQKLGSSERVWSGLFTKV